MIKIKKMFQGRVDDLPVIAEFVSESLERDLPDFNAYSPRFNTALIADIRSKVTVCRSAMRAWMFTKELKTTTARLYATMDAVRLPLNILEGYIKLAGTQLDVAPKDMGLHEVRRSIKNDNAETLPPALRQLMTSVQRNLPALYAAGLPPSLVDELNAQPATIEALNLRQNTLASERNRLTETDMQLFNDLWLAIAPLFETGKALYKGIDPAKLKDYTFAELVRRLHPHRTVKR
jgi:hypothetical protein